MLSAFWDKAYVHAFDGGSVLVPTIHPHMDMELFPALGTILSHGFLSSGFMPVHLAFPILVAILLGPNATLSDHILIASLANCLSHYESSIVGQSLNESDGQPKCFTGERTSQLISILSRLGCREIPKPEHLKRLCYKWLSMSAPATHREFWNGFSVEKLFALYTALNATPQQVLVMTKDDVT